MDEDRLAELEQMVKDANDTVMETEKRFAEVCCFIYTDRNWLKFGCKLHDSDFCNPHFDAVLSIQ